MVLYKRKLLDCVFCTKKIDFWIVELKDISISH